MLYFPWGSSPFYSQWWHLSNVVAFFKNNNDEHFITHYSWNISCCLTAILIFIFLAPTRYFKAVTIQPRIIKPMKHKSIAYLLLQVILILCLHLSTVFLFKVLITKRTMNHQKSLLPLMLKQLQNHSLRCCMITAIACYCLFCL